MDQSSFADLIERVRGGDEQAVLNLFDEYGDAIRREVRFSMLDNRMKRVVSESDVCQSVMTRLYVGLWAGKYEFESPEQLVALLKTMVRSKVADLARYWRSQKRDMRRNTVMDTHIGRISPAADGTPSQIVANAELLHEVRERLSERELKMLMLRQQKTSWAEIAEQLGGDASPEAVRKQYERALTRVADELGVDEL